MKYLVLLSGGMDSTIAYYNSLESASKVDGGSVYSLTFDYGQRHRKEINHASTIVKQAQSQDNYGSVVRWHHTVRFADLMIPQTGSLLTTQKVDTYSDIADANNATNDQSFIPHRNLLFLTIAAMWARHHNVNKIITGLRGGFPDCTESFESQVASVLNQSDPENLITISGPVHMSRKASVLLAMTIPGCMDALAHSLTCFNGIEPPCGKCLPCLKREEGFALAGVPDPLIERLGLKKD